MRFKNLLLSLLLVLSACSQTHPGYTPDQAQLLDKSRDILNRVVFTGQLDKLYEESSQIFKDSVNLPILAQKLGELFRGLPQTEVSLLGYEEDKAEHLLRVYAHSASQIKPLNYRLVYSIDQDGGLQLTKLSVQANEFDKSIAYRPFAEVVKFTYPEETSGQS